jgi:glycyl-tRNA synthetase
MADEQPPEETVQLMAMLKRRGFLKSAYELYGGVAGLYDYGPLGQGLKRNFEDLWRQYYVVEEGFGEVSTPTVAPRAVFEASGHLDQFDDTLVECLECGAAFRADHYLEDEWPRLVGELQPLAEEHGWEDLFERVQETTQVVVQEAEREPGPEEIEDLLSGAHPIFDPDSERTVQTVFHRDDYTIAVEPWGVRVEDPKGGVEWKGRMECASCGEPIDADRASIGPFNLMFSTRIGPGDGDPGFLRPETAQGLFVNSQWLYRYEREQVPFGAVQIGRAYRNEISPRQGLVRLREFWQAEAEVFVDPDDKTHPDFEHVADHEVDLVPAEGEDRRTTLREAVDEGVIANEMVAYFVGRTQQVLTEAGVDRERLRFRQHESDEMAHYATDCWDAEFESARYGWVECVGIADRGCYDLESHEEESGERMRVFRRYDETIEREVTRVEPDMSQLGPEFKGQAGDVAEALRALDAEELDADEDVEVTVDGERVEVPADTFEVVQETEREEGEWVYPHVIEPSYGVDRILYAVLEHNWHTAGERDRLGLPAPLAPVDVGVFPLVSKDGLPEKAREIETELKRAGLVTTYDDGGSIGRRYARQDEIGTPVCVTVDHETLEEGTVTVRERDSTDQVRVPVDELADRLEALAEGEVSFAELA